MVRPPLPPGRDAGDPRLARLDAAIRVHQHRGDALIEVLHAAQRLYGYLPEDVLLHVARELRLPPSRVHGVATFYHLFTLRPPGEHVVTVCTGTACHVKGAPGILSAVTRAGGVAAGEASADGELSVAVVRCVGTCGLAPVVSIDGRIVGRLSEDALRSRLSGREEP